MVLSISVSRVASKSARSNVSLLIWRRSRSSVSERCLRVVADAAAALTSEVMLLISDLIVARVLGFKRIVTMLRSATVASIKVALITNQRHDLAAARLTNACVVFKNGIVEGVDQCIFICGNVALVDKAGVDSARVNSSGGGETRKAHEGKDVAKELHSAGKVLRYLSKAKTQYRDRKSSKS